MPCLDGGPTHYQHDSELQRLKKTEAILCAICTRLQSILTENSYKTIFDTLLLDSVD